MTRWPLSLLVCLSGCTDATTDPMQAGDSVDITNAVFASQDPACSAHTGSFVAHVRDLGRGVNFDSDVEITAGGGRCTLTSNSIPNHDFNSMGMFATAVREVVETFSIPGSPSAAATTTALTLDYDNGVFLNGVKLDVRAAACYGVGGGPLGQEKIGCNVSATPWRYDPMFAGNSFGTDANHAHTQPDGAYHYHGDPLAVYDRSGNSASGVIGYAADGFPIFGPFIDDNGVIRRARSGFTLKQGARQNQAGEAAFPGGNYDGRFIDDWEWTDAGDLDACNGMTRNGTYGYYVTDSYPWVIGCFRGTRDPSFHK